MHWTAARPRLRQMRKPISPATASSQEQKPEDPDADFDHLLQEAYGLTILKRCADQAAE